MSDGSLTEATTDRTGAPVLVGTAVRYSQFVHQCFGGSLTMSAIACSRWWVKHSPCTKWTVGEKHLSDSGSATRKVTLHHTP
jgi:hypothetical protein